MKNPITDLMVLEAFHAFQRQVNMESDSFCRRPYQRLMMRSKMPKEMCIAACNAIIERGLVNSPHVMEASSLMSLARADMLITPAGKQILGVLKDDPGRIRKPQGPDLLIEGWKWK